MSNIKFVITLLFIVLLYSNNSVYGQNSYVTGTVKERSPDGKAGMTLIGANVFWLSDLSGTTTDTDGKFRLLISGNLPQKLVISYVGYTSDTVIVSKPGDFNINLSPTVALNTVTVEGRQESTVLSTIKPINTEQLGQKELLKAACCNLSESFETNPSVNVSYSDAITGAKEIQMLGLSGIYSQVMTENIPFNHGLGATYGLSYVPGTWMESIQITKGSGSVANGYESTTGQINIEYLKPHDADKIYVNAYGASSGNAELNIHKGIKVNDHTSTLVLFHGENMSVKRDHQNDSFLDMPLVSNYNLMNRWAFNDGKKFEGQFGVKVLTDLRRSGQTFYDWGEKADTSTGYGVRIKTNRIEAYSKTGLIFPETPWKSAGLILSGSLHDQNSYFGLKTYDGYQGSFYGSLIYMSIISNTNHKWKAGIDYRYDSYNENYIGTSYDRTEAVPGAYLEYTLNIKDKFGAVAGSRVDYHNEWKWIYTPRLHLKYNFTPETIVRLSGGRSFRTSNVFADNISIMATSRSLTIEEKLLPERAWNYGANFTHKFMLFYRQGSISVDYYITDFTNQVIVDTYSSPDKIEIYNLKGDSYSRSFQIAFSYECFKRFDLKLAYKNDQVVTDYKGIPSQKPLVPEHRALANVAYASRNDKWRYDATLQYHGMTRLAVSDATQNNIGGHDSQVKNNRSPEYITINGQITHIFNKKWEVYTGVENLTNYRQEITVLNADDPFGEGFDATNVWGPVMGIKIYGGLRFVIPADKKNSN